MDYSLPGSSVHGISQARILEWVAIPPSGVLLNPGIEPVSPMSAVDSLPLHHLGRPVNQLYSSNKVCLKTVGLLNL